MVKLLLSRGLRCLVVLPAPPAGANLILVDIGSKRKLWTKIAPQRLRDILARIGAPA